MGISSAGRAPALHAGGQEFDPLILHHELFRFKEAESFYVKKKLEARNVYLEN